MVQIRLAIPTHWGGRQEYWVRFRDLLMWRQAMGMLPQPARPRSEINWFDLLMYYRHRDEMLAVLDSSSDDEDELCLHDVREGTTTQVQRKRWECLKILEGKRSPEPLPCPRYILSTIQYKEEKRRRRNKAGEKMKKTLGERLQRNVKKLARHNALECSAPQRLSSSARVQGAGQEMIMSYHEEPRRTSLKSKRWRDSDQTLDAKINGWEHLRRIIMSSLYASQRKPFRLCHPQNGPKRIYLLVTRLLERGQAVTEVRDLTVCTLGQFMEAMAFLEDRGWRDLIWVCEAGEKPPKKVSVGTKPKRLEWGCNMF